MSEIIKTTFGLMMALISITGWLAWRRKNILIFLGGFAGCYLLSMVILANSITITPNNIVTTQQVEKGEK